MQKTIGFATQYYTLWDHVVTPHYTTDAYGNHHHDRNIHSYYYIKNISTDLEKVKAQYPDVVIDESLRGKTRDWQYTEHIEKPAGFFWFGKYYGMKIDDILLSDFSYCLWAMDYNRGAGDYIRDNAIYQLWRSMRDLEEQKIIDAADTVKAGDVVELFFTSNGYNADDDYSVCWVAAELNGTKIHVKVSEGCKPVFGKYPYLMPVIHGKARRTKLKAFPVTILEAMEPTLDASYLVHQNVTI